MKTERSNNIDIYHFREKGVEYCKTDGSPHYRGGSIEPIEFAIANNRFEDFAITNIHKYAERFAITRNPDDLKKVADYAHILCGVELETIDEEGE